MRGTPEVLSLLLEARADPNSQSPTGLCMCVFFPFCALVCLVFLVSCLYRSDAAALVHVGSKSAQATKDAVQCVQLLIQHGERLRRDSQGSTPLKMVITSCADDDSALALVTALMTAPNSAKRINERGCSTRPANPLAHAAMRGFGKCVEFLLSRQADCNLSSGQGRDTAAGHVELVLVGLCKVLCVFLECITLLCARLNGCLFEYAGCGTINAIPTRTWFRNASPLPS